MAKRAYVPWLNNAPRSPQTRAHQKRATRNMNSVVQLHCILLPHIISYVFICANITCCGGHLFRCTVQVSNVLVAQDKGVEMREGWWQAIFRQCLAGLAAGSILRVLLEYDLERWLSNWDVKLGWALSGRSNRRSTTTLLLAHETFACFVILLRLLNSLILPLAPLSSLSAGVEYLHREAQMHCAPWLH